ncbi:MAG: TRAP transporter small permease [Alphaproteobacteria bacterium]|nr:TRAP transporter small permease [Alphaproteobacteria bacterium]
MTNTPPPSKTESEVLEPHFIEDVEVRFSDYSIEDYIVLVIFWALAVIVFAQFFSRYVLNDSIAWTEEVARYLLITIAFAGAPIAVRKNTHIHVEFFYRFIPARVARVLSTAVDLIRIVFFAYATYLSYKIIGLMGAQYMTAIHVSMGVIYACVFIGFMAMTLRAIQVAWKHWRQGFSVLDQQTEVMKTS